MTITAPAVVHTTTGLTIKWQRLCVWSAVVMLTGIFAGLITAGWFPPPSPGDSADEVAAYYIDSGWRIRIGMITMVMLAPLALPLVALIGLHLWQMEGRRWAPLALVQVTCGTLTVLAPVLPALIWLINAYQPASRPASEVKLLHDMGWLLFVGTAFFALVQNLAIAFAALSTDKPSVFPRWVGYFNLWTALLYAPGVLVFCFSSGPMAWNGIVAFWIPVGAVGAWYIVMITLLFRADARTLYDWER
jgi:hypothetical protein